MTALQYIFYEVEKYNYEGRKNAHYAHIGDI